MLACKIYDTMRQLSGLVVEGQPAALKAGVQTPVGVPKNFQN